MWKCHSHCVSIIEPNFLVQKDVVIVLGTASVVLVVHSGARSNESITLNSRANGPFRVASITASRTTLAVPQAFKFDQPLPFLPGFPAVLYYISVQKNIIDTSNTRRGRRSRRVQVGTVRCEATWRTASGRSHSDKGGSSALSPLFRDDVFVGDTSELEVAVLRRVRSPQQLAMAEMSIC